MNEQTKQETRNPHLEWAWKRFALYDTNSIALKPRFLRFAMWIMALGVITTFLVVVQEQFFKSGASDTPGTGSPWEIVFRYLIISIPITMSVLVAASNRFKPGYRSVILRAAAEAVKKEIFRYRMLSALGFTSGLSPYESGFDSHESPPPDEEKPIEKSYVRSPEGQMVERINGIHNDLMKTELNLSGLTPYEGELPPPSVSDSGDDGFKPLTPDRYLQFRVSGQIDYYERSTRILNVKLEKLLWGIYIFGGAGTLLASIGLELWVALTTSLAGVCTAYIESRQIESIIVMYNQSAASLMEIKSGWGVLPPEEREKKENVLSLLERVEMILLSEHSQWLRQMDDRTNAGDGS